MIEEKLNGVESLNLLIFPPK